MSAPHRDPHHASKPVVDAVIDAVSALSELARSLRARADHPVRRARAEVRTIGRKAVKTGRRIAREVKAAVRGEGDKLERTLRDFSGRARAAAAAARTPRHAPPHVSNGADRPAHDDLD